MRVGPQTLECTIWSIEVDWISCLFKRNLCIFALIQEVQDEQHASILLKVKEWFTDCIAKWRSFAVGCLSL